MRRSRALPGLLVVAVVVTGATWVDPARVDAKPVSPRLLAFLQRGPIPFKPARPGARPRISAASAGRDAARDVQWRPARATGASLVRMGRGTGVPESTLAWLVALRTRHPLYDLHGGPAANYVVALIRASDGRFLGAAAGYSPELAGRSGGISWGMAELAAPGRRR